MVQRRECWTDPQLAVSGEFTCERCVADRQDWRLTTPPTERRSWTNCGETSSLRGKRKQPHQSQECFLVQIHTENIMKTQRSTAHTNTCGRVDASIWSQCERSTVYTLRLTLCRCVGLVWGLRWSHRTKAEVSSPRSSHVDHNSPRMAAHATRVKRVMENKDHLTHHSRASKWVADRSAADEEGLAGRPCCEKIVLCCLPWSRFLFPPGLILSVWHLSGLKSQKKTEITSITKERWCQRATTTRQQSAPFVVCKHPEPPGLLSSRATFLSF